MIFQINRKKIIPDFNEYMWVMLSAVITVYVFKPIVLRIFPVINTLNSFFQLLILIFAIVYFKDLININRNGRDLF